MSARRAGEKTPLPPAGGRMIRFSLFERVIHWVVALSFVVLALTGLGLYYPSLFWLTSLFGGGPASRALHPWAGVVFTASLLVMGLMWVRSMLLNREDGAWLKRVSAYVAHRPGELPPVGRFNAGQKLLFWIVLFLGAVEFATGWFMWDPATYGGSALMRWAYPLHSLAAAGYLALIVLHIYMGTLMLPGTFQTMTHGRIPRTWAQVHHARWLQEVEARETPVGVGATPPARH
ncbi:formate dehydrogenase subunit gamma [Limnochorda pilosa]|uniref:Formate dehydrogenase subunit gamma n=1 Tax=Limnochorda pilosa TaxID=1555112 RepID=A0A0K2SLG2_LIMPI|nr:formate dehydrogenase subunit gamma [Limnochorda pilosa]BAS27654.1 formate dehydrogenase subunit gamma [Limnochorda pilosa]